MQPHFFLVERAQSQRLSSLRRKSRRSPEGRRFKLPGNRGEPGDGSAVKKKRIKKRRLCNWASKGDISRVRPVSGWPPSRRGDRPWPGLALADSYDTTWLRTREGWCALYDKGRSDPRNDDGMPCYRGRREESRAPPGNIAYNYVHRREDTHALWMRCIRTPLYVHPSPSPSSVNHVTGLVNSPNDLKRCARLVDHPIFFFFFSPCFPVFFLASSRSLSITFLHRV